MLAANIVSQTCLLKEADGGNASQRKGPWWRKSKGHSRVQRATPRNYGLNQRLQRHRAELGHSVPCESNLNWQSPSLVPKRVKSSGTFQKSEVEGCEYQDDSYIHRQPFPEVVLEEQKIYNDHNGYQEQHVKAWSPGFPFQPPVQIYDLHWFDYSGW
jgi:hypothetical protein